MRVQSISTNNYQKRQNFTSLATALQKLRGDKILNKSDFRDLLLSYDKLNQSDLQKIFGPETNLNADNLKYLIGGTSKAWFWARRLAGFNKTIVRENPGVNFSLKYEGLGLVLKAVSDGKERTLYVAPEGPNEDFYLAANLLARTVLLPYN